MNEKPNASYISHIKVRRLYVIFHLFVEILIFPNPKFRVIISKSKSFYSNHESRLA